MHKKNLYTFILLKNYEQLKQVRFSPVTFWTIISLFIFLCILCVASLLTTFFIWRNFIAINVEKDSLYKQHIITEARLNRLLAFEAAILKEKEYKTELKNTTSIKPTESSPAQSLPTQETTKEETNQNPTTEQKNTLADNTTKKGEPKKSVFGKELTSTKIALRNASLDNEHGKLYLAFELHNMQSQKISGTISYEAYTTKDTYIPITPREENSNSFSIRSFKTVKTALQLPNNLNPKNIQGIIITLSSDKNPLVIQTVKLP